MSEDNVEWITCKDLAKILGCTTRTILNMVNSKNIEHQRNIRGKYYINKAHFLEIYPKALKNALEQEAKEDSLDKTKIKIMEEKISFLESVVGEKNQQIKYLVKQNLIEDRKQLKMLDLINTQTKLIEEKLFKRSSNTEKSKNSLDCWNFKSEYQTI